MEVDAYPYAADISAKIQQFYRKKNKAPADFKYTETGDIVLGDTVIPLKGYVPLTKEERQTMEDDRLAKLIKVEADIEEKKRELREVFQAYREGREDAGAVVRLNQEVDTLERQRALTRSQERSILEVDNPVIREILLDQPNDTRKLLGQEKDPFGKVVFKLYLQDFKPMFFYGKYVERGEGEGQLRATIELEETRTLLSDGRIARLFFGNTDADLNYMLSPGFAAEVVLNDTKYSSAIQAFEAERARELGLEEVRKKLMATRSVRTIDIIMRGVKEQVKNPAELWFEVLNNLYLQHPELQEVLLATGTDMLVYADPKSTLYGIGVGIDDERRLNPKQWRGENLVGRALERFRTQLRETGPPADVAPVEATEAVITEEAQAQAKKAAIIRSRRS
jgi:predicted NAD-dependent protein-ADP-ribosyltransferase YbiA (DUF1768 family)